MKKSDIRKFCKTYKSLEEKGTYDWKILDEALLSICETYPAHTSEGEVFSKVAIINRTYRANLHLSGNNIETEVANTFVKHRLDSLLAPLNSIDALTTESLPTLVRAHGRVVTIARDVTKRIHNSFVSKYLHFTFRILFQYLTNTLTRNLGDWPRFQKVNGLHGTIS